jgi:transcription elongation factor GreA
MPRAIQVTTLLAPFPELPIDFPSVGGIIFLKMNLRERAARAVARPFFFGIDGIRRSRFPRPARTIAPVSRDRRSQHMDRQPISREGFDKLREDLRHLENVEMPAVSQAIADARSEGDLRENAEYHGQRERQGLLQARINTLRTKLADCYIVDKASLPKGVVTFGTRVTVKDLKFDDIEQYVFVGPGEEDFEADIKKILTTSPFAQAMMGKKVGDVVEFQAPRGMQKYEVTGIDEV